jgi:signal transduction histidine kinase
MLKDSFDKQRVAVDARYEEGLPSVSCDENQIRHALINLFLNALEAMEHKGKLSIATHLDKQKDNVEIRISDTGPGIRLKDRDEIFKPTFSTKKKKAGSGYGLPITRRIVMAHGGSVELGPSTTKGGTFTVKLPISE